MKTSFLLMRRSPIVLIRNFIVIEILGYGSFLLAGALADYEGLYRTLPFQSFLSYQVVQLTFVLLCQLILTFFIFLDWQYTSYRLEKETLIASRGFFIRRKTTIPLRHIETVSRTYGLLGKIFDYGTIILEQNNSQKRIKLSSISSPQKYVALLMKLKKTAEAYPLKELPTTITLLSQEESETLEFKSTFRWDLKTKQVNRQLEKAVLKTIAAFLNSSGGFLVLGVDNDKTVIGLQDDYHSLRRPNADGFENHFTLVFNDTIGPTFRPFVKLHFQTYEGKEICVIEVRRAEDPAYLVIDGVEEFYVRTGNSTTPLGFSEAASYLNLWRRSRT